MVGRRGQATGGDGVEQTKPIKERLGGVCKEPRGTERCKEHRKAMGGIDLITEGGVEG